MNSELLNLTPEEQFILACLRTEFSGSGDADFPAFNYDSFDWNRVYNKSLQWRIAPLLYKIMEKCATLINTPKIPKQVTAQPPPLTPPTRGGEKDISKLVQTGSCHVTSPLRGEGMGGGELLPKDFFEKIKVEYLITCVANNAIYTDLAEISGVFSKAGIKFILLKGSHLAQFVYNDIGTRPMGDIDILVKKDDLSRAEELLLQMEYYCQDERKGGIDNGVIA